MRPRLGDLDLILLPLAALLLATPSAAQVPNARKIGELDLTVLGVTATPEPREPVVPKTIASALRIVVRAGEQELSAGDVARFLGAGFEVQGELSGPGLNGVITLPVRDPDAPLPADPLLLPIPGLPVGGVYQISNLRIVVGGNVALDVNPPDVPLRVIDQILVSSVQTRALTLDEIRAKGIVLDSDDYLGFEFTLALATESTPINFSFPVVFDRQGIAVPMPLQPPPDPGRGGISFPGGFGGGIVPVLLEGTDAGGNPMPITMPGGGGPVRIPGVIVIPGNVGYLKQFFSAMLYVANGAPVGSNLRIREVTGRLRLPPGNDLEPGTADDPLALPTILRDGQPIPQPLIMPVRGVGPDGVPGTSDDVGTFDPGEQGQAEFLIRAEDEGEGFHTIEFDLGAVLDGLPVGPVNVQGKAKGGLLVRNPFFDMTFTVPSVVRNQEEFPLYVTVNNIGRGLANDVTVTLDGGRMSGAEIVGSAERGIDTLRPGDSKTLEFRLRSLTTGQVVASYLRMRTEAGRPHLRFTLGVGERGVVLSPDTLVLPAAVDAIPGPVVTAAMRVLGQAWSVAKSPTGTLPVGVIRSAPKVVVQKALALAEAGLRTGLGQDLDDALRDVATDFFGGEPDPGFDQLLRQTDAGRDLSYVLGAHLAPSAAGDPRGYEERLARLLGSGDDFVTFAVEGNDLPVDIAVSDGSGRVSAYGRDAEEIPGLAVPGAFFFPLGAPDEAPVLGYIATPSASPYTLSFTGRQNGQVSFSLTLPDGNGRFVRAQATFLTAAGRRARLVVDLSQPSALVLEEDHDGDGSYETTELLAASLVGADGPALVAANVIGPETLDGASPTGMQLALLFDRPVKPETAAVLDNYSIPDNRVRAAKAQLSGRLVFAALELPEGNYRPNQLTVAALEDLRGNLGSSDTRTLVSRITDGGAVVTGQVLHADGTPVDGGTITYFNYLDPTCRTPGPPPPVAQAQLRSGGRYELRYVRKDPCGSPFQIVTRDPVSGALREVSRYVRGPGEQIVLDIVLLGRGSVAGAVRYLDGSVAGGARVTVRSVTDAQSGGTAVADNQGRYLVNGISVGPVSVVASQGISLGTSAGRIDRAGTTATVDVILDGGTVSVSGRVSKLEAGATTPAALAYVLFYAVDPPIETLVGVDQADGEGRYAFTGMPTGLYSIKVTLHSGHSAARSGTAAAGDVLTDQDLVVVVPPPTSLATITGLVRMPDGSPAGGVIVAVDSVGTLSGPDGRYEIRGVPVRANQSVGARTRDGLRQAYTSFSIFEPGQVLEVSPMTLSALGTAVFTVLDPAGNPVPNVQVRRLSGCADPCGCAPMNTNVQGQVRYENYPLGNVAVQAYRGSGSGTDVVSGSVSITQEGVPAFGILRFKGFGSVSGLVVDDLGDPAHGAEVALSSLVFVNDGVNTCGLQMGQSHTSRTGTDGRFRYTGVHVGTVTVTASQIFLPTPVGRQGTITADGQEITFQLQLVDTMAGELSGFVTLPDGVTPAGAGVEVTVNGVLPDVTVHTDAAGHYRFALVLPAGPYTLTARDGATGGLTRKLIHLQRRVASQHDLRLKGKGDVEVRVVDGGDVPVTQAFVRLRESEFPNRLHEGAVEPANEGVFTFRNVFEGPFSLEAFDSVGRGARASAVLPGPGMTVPVKLRLTVTGRVEGRFVMPDGSGIPFGTVRLIAAGRSIGQVTTLSSGDVGFYSFEFVPAGNVRLEAEDPATGRTGVAVARLETEDEVLNLDVTAQAIGIVEGLVTHNGLARSGAQVSVRSGQTGVFTSSDEAGRYRVPGVAEGLVTVTASLGEGFLSGSVSAPLAGEGTVLSLDVALRSSGTVIGQVLDVDGTTGRPAVVSASGSAYQTANTGADGGYRFERIPSGSVSLTADALGSIDVGRSSAQVPVGATVEVPITLNGVGEIRGHTFDSAGQPIAGWLQLQGTGSFPWGFSLLIGGDGAFRMPEVLAGPVTLSFFARVGGIDLYGTAAGEISPGQVTTLDVQLQPSGTVTGRVFRSNGTSPAFGAEALVRLADNRSVTVQAGDDGRFTARGVPLAALQVSFRDPLSGGRAIRTGLALTENGQTLDVGTVVLDDTAPTLAFVTPAEGATRAALAGALVIDLADSGTAGLDPTTLQVFYGPALGQSASAFQIVDGRASGMLLPERLAIGVNQLRAVARDLSGNEGQAFLSFTVTGGTLRGLVYTAAGAPAVGASVQVGTLPAVTVGGDGRYVRTGLRPGSYTVRATDPATGLNTFVFVQLPDGEDVTVPDLVLPAFGSIAGVVRHPDGTAANGVTVSTANRSATTGPDGAYLLPALPLGTYSVEATDPANGDRGRATALLASLGQQVTANVTLNGVGSVTVRVRDAGGATVAGAQVTVVTDSAFGGTYQGTTNGAGEVSFPTVLAGTLTATAVDTLGLRGTATQLLLDRAAVTMTVDLEPAGRVAGVVSRRNGGPAAGVAVRLVSRTVVTGTDGAFLFEAVPLGAFDLIATDAATGDRGAAAGTLAAGGTTATANITLNGVGTVRVLVRDSVGADVAGASVTVRSDSPFGGLYSGPTGADGRVTFSPVLAGNVTVSAFFSGLTGTVTVPLDADATIDVTVTLEPVATLRGRVLQPNGTDPVAGATVRTGSRTATSAEDGSYQFTGLTLGTYTVEALVDGRLRARVGGVVLDTPGADVSQDLVLIGVAPVTGLVTDPAGAPAAGASVQLQSQVPTYGGTFGPANTGADGRYTINGVPVGAFTLSATRGNDRADASGSVTVHGTPVTVNLQLAASAVTLPRNLTDGNGHLYQVRADGAFSFAPWSMLVAGSAGLSLVHEGQTFTFAGSGNVAATEEAFREIVVSQAGPAGLEVTRKVYIPAQGYFVRRLELLRNPGPDPVTVDLGLEAVLGWNAGVIATSSGDGILTPLDRWAVFDDGETNDVWDGAAHFAPLAWAASGPDAEASPSTFEYNAPTRRLVTRWADLTVPAGQTVGILHVMSVQADRTRGPAAANRLDGLPPELLTGLSPEEAAAVRNFAVPPDLQSALPALPPNDGVVTGHVSAHDGVTPVPGTHGTFRSRSLYLSRPVSVSGQADGTYAFRPSAGLIPRVGFDLRFTVNMLGTRTTTASGDFPATGIVELGSLAGRTVLASSSYPNPCCIPEHAVDGDVVSIWQTTPGDAANLGQAPFVEAGFPVPATVHEVRLRNRRDGAGLGSRIRRVRVEVRDAAAAVLWSTDVDLPLPDRDADVPVPQVALARAVRIVSLADDSPNPGLAEVSIYGEASGGPTGRAQVDLSFTGTAILEGQVQRSDGTPVPGGSVFLSDGNFLNVASPSSEGRFRFLTVPPGTHSLQANYPGGGATATVPQVVVPADQTVTQDIVYAPFGGVTGHVRSAAGQLLPNRVVSLARSGFGRSVLTQAGGDYTFLDVPPGVYTLSATDNGRSNATVTQTDVDIPAGPPVVRDFMFPPVGRLEVLVTANGSPLAGAWVYTQSDFRGQQFHGTTNVSGRFTVNNAPGPVVTVTAVHGLSSHSTGEADATLTADGETLNVTVAVPAVGAITGTLRSRDGTAVGAGTVRAVRPSDGVVLASDAVDAAGAFSVPNVPAGALQLLGERPFEGYWDRAETLVTMPPEGGTLAADALVSMGALATPGERQLWEFDAAAGRTVFLLLRGEAFGTHAALAAPSLEVYGPDGVRLPRGTSPPNPLTITTTAAGRHVAIVAGGGAGGYRLGTANSDIAFRPYAGSSVRGRLTRDTDGAGYAGASVRVGTTPGGPTATDGQGYYALPLTATGSFTVEALDAEGVVIAQGAGEVATEGGQATVDLVAAVHAPVTVTATRAAVGLPGVVVTISSDHATAPLSDRVRVRTTSAAGTLTTSLPLGQVTATATFDGVPSQATGTLLEGTPLTLALTFEVPTTLLGSVRNQGGQSVLPGATVSVAGAGAATVDAAGNYRVEGIPPGTRVVTATFGPATATQTVVFGGGELTRNFILPVTVVQGRVTEPGGVTGVPARVTAVPFGGDPGSTVQVDTDEQGNYILRGLPAAWDLFSTLQMQATASDGSGLNVFGFRTRSGHGTYGQNFVMPATGAVSALVRRAGGVPAGGVTVYLQQFSQLRQTRTTAPDGTVHFPHVFAQPVRLYADDPVTGATGAAEGEVVLSETLALTIDLAAVGELTVTLDASAAGPRDIVVQAAEAARLWPDPWHPSYAPWQRSVTLEPGATTTVGVPVGLWRALLTDEPVAAAEGLLSPGETQAATVTPGSHVALPRLLEGTDGSYFTGNDWQCPVSPCGIFLTPRAAAVENDPLVAEPRQDGRELRGLLVAGPVYQRRLYYVPPSGEFARTLTILTNPGPTAATVPLDTSLRPGTTEIYATSDGDQEWETTDGYLVLTSGLVWGPLIPATGVSLFDSEGGVELHATHEVTVPAGESRAFLTFSIQRNDEDLALTTSTAQSLLDLTHPQALVGLNNAERALIVNYDAPLAGAVSGTVRAPGGGAPVAGVPVSVVRDGEVRGTATTDSAGLFIVEGLPAGDYSVVAVQPPPESSANPGRPGRVAVTITGSATSEVTISLLSDAEMGAVAVTGTLETSGDPAAGAPVVLVADGYWPAWAPSLELDPAGQGTFPAVPAGPVSVAWGEGYLGDPQTAQIVAATTTNVALVLSGVPVVLPADLSGAEAGWQLETWGALSNVGNCAPFCGTEFAIDGYYLSAESGLLRMEGREVLLGPLPLGGLQVSRRVYVPPSGRFARFLDVLANPSAQPVTVPLTLAGYYYSSIGEPVTVFHTSSGDTTFDVADNYLVTGSAGTEHVATVLAGPGAAGRFSSVSLQDFGALYHEVTWPDLTVPPGGTVLVLQFAARRPEGEGAAVLAQAESLMNLTDPDALRGLAAAERAAVINFVIP